MLCCARRATTALLACDGATPTAPPRADGGRKQSNRRVRGHKLMLCGATEAWVAAGSNGATAHADTYCAPPQRRRVQEGQPRVRGQAHVLRRHRGLDHGFL